MNKYLLPSQGSNTAFQVIIGVKSLHTTLKLLRNVMIIEQGNELLI